MQIKTTWKQHSKLLSLESVARTVDFLHFPFSSFLRTPSLSPLLPISAEDGAPSGLQTFGGVWGEDMCPLLHFSYSPSPSGWWGHTQKTSESKSLICGASHNCQSFCHIQPRRERVKPGVRHTACRGNVGKHTHTSEKWAAFHSPENTRIYFACTRNTETGQDQISYCCTGVPCC